MGFDVDRMTLRWRTLARYSNECELGPYIMAFSPCSERPTHYVAEVCGAPYLGSKDSWPIARLLAASPRLLAASIAAAEVMLLNGLDQSEEMDELLAAIADARGMDKDNDDLFAPFPVPDDDTHPPEEE